MSDPLSNPVRCAHHNDSGKHPLSARVLDLVLLLTLVMIVVLPACSPVAPGTVTRANTITAMAITPNQLPGWSNDDLAGLETAISRQCELTAPPAPWPRLCAEFRQQRATLRPWIESRFRAWPLLGVDQSDSGLVTGYYEPILTGSRVRENSRQVPLYKRPTDLLRIELPANNEPAGNRLRGRLIQDRVVPYYTRAEIETRGVLDGQELIWLDDPVEAFFLQVQGSGRVLLRNGQRIRVVFHETNGHPYRAIGRVMADRGLLPADGITAPAIKSWLRANPSSAAEVLHQNPRYVFFREQPEGAADAGPPGSLAVPLTPLRSIASDPRVVPPGSLVYMNTRHPATQAEMNRLMVSQDTGVAIVGPIRADVFWGNGVDAEQNAGLMQSRGRMWLLWPADMEPPLRPVR